MVLRRSARADAVFRAPMAGAVRRGVLADAGTEPRHAAALLVLGATPKRHRAPRRWLHHSGGDVARAVHHYRGVVVTRLSPVELGRLLADLGGPLDSRRQPGTVRAIQIRHGPDLCGDRVADRSQRTVQDRGKGFPGRIVLLRDLHFCRLLRQASLAGCADCHREATSERDDAAPGLSLHGDRSRGHHDRSMDAVLSAVFHRGEGRYPPPI